VNAYIHVVVVFTLHFYGSLLIYARNHSLGLENRSGE